MMTDDTKPRLSSRRMVMHATRVEPDPEWTDHLLADVYELAFLPDLADYEDVVAGRHNDYALRVRRIGDTLRIHGFADVVWAGGDPDWAPYLPQLPQAYPHEVYPTLRDAVDDGLPGAMAAHTEVIHNMLKLKRQRLNELKNRPHAAPTEPEASDHA